ncbi:hypothetical protein E2C01_093756 [Portunus trituberculatus]|uniref:Uncharacterized protein n=1 Tax=Portunus trituberculatus TaxID=210409 RepID=A0A5B7JZ02_PORTR|nr:hypothetical protein [Portunus trituberculatus]
MIHTEPRDNLRNLEQYNLLQSYIPQSEWFPSRRYLSPALRAQGKWVPDHRHIPIPYCTPPTFTNDVWLVWLARNEGTLTDYDSKH